LSYWKDLDKIVIENEFAKGDLAEGSRNYVQCQDGKVAAYAYAGDDNDGRRQLQIFDASSGDDIPIAFVYVTPGVDMLQGLFTTGIIPTLDIFDVNCRFLRVDYNILIG